MPFFSISTRKGGRVGEPKTTFNVGELEPTSDEAIEIRVADGAFSDQLAFWSEFERAERRMRELGEPRPQPGVGLIVIDGDPWSDGTFWTDGTGWRDGGPVMGEVWNDGFFFDDGFGWDG